LNPRQSPEKTTAAVQEVLRSKVERPESLKQESYDRTLKARAFDVARYLLPLATNTSLGQIVSARALETQVSRLVSNPIAEVRELGNKLRDAATGPAWNVNAVAAAAFVEKLKAAEAAAALKGHEVSGHYLRTNSAGEPRAENASGGQEVSGHDFSRAVNAQLNEGVLTPGGSLAAEAEQLFTREVRTAPTLVKYAQPNAYLMQTRAELEQAAAEILAPLSSETLPHAVVDLVERTESLEVELAATLLYSASHYSYRQIRDLVSGLSAVPKYIAPRPSPF